MTTADAGGRGGKCGRREGGKGNYRIISCRDSSNRGQAVCGTRSGKWDESNDVSRGRGPGAGTAFRTVGTRIDGSKPKCAANRWPISSRLIRSGPPTCNRPQKSETAIACNEPAAAFNPNGVRH